MGNIYAVAGRPLCGKTQYLQKLCKQMESYSLFVSAADYTSFDEMMNSLAKRIMDSDNITTIAIDDLEVELIKEWNEQIDEDSYQQKLQILSGFADNYDLDIYFAVGMKREADLNSQPYCSEQFLRSEVIAKEVDGVFFLMKK